MDQEILRDFIFYGNKLLEFALKSKHRRKDYLSKGVNNI